MHEPNLLRLLLTQRHLLRYETFRRRFEAAARELAQRDGDPRLGRLTVGERQFNRWLYGSLTGQPRPDACRVLEHLTGRSVVELFAPPPAEPVCRSPEPETPAGQSQATDAVAGSRVATGIHRAEEEDTDRRELLGLAAASLLAEATTRSLRRVQRLGSSNEGYSQLIL